MLMAGEDAEAEPGGDRDTAHKGAGELGEQQEAATLIAERPLLEKLRQQRTEQHRP